MAEAALRFCNNRMRGLDVMLQISEEHQLRSSDAGLIDFKPAEVSVADGVAIMFAVGAAIYSRQTGRNTRRIGAFDSTVVPHAYLFIELLEQQLRRLQAIMAMQDQAVVDAFYDLRASYTDWLGDIDTAYAKFDTSLRTWRMQHSDNKNKISIRGVDVLYIRGNAMMMQPEPINLSDVLNENFSEMVFEISNIINNAREVLAHYEKKYSAKAFWIF